MNYKRLAHRKFLEFLKECPEWSLGQIMYHTLIMHNKFGDFKKKDFLQLTDKEVYSAMSKALAQELEYRRNEFD
jgi:hypothetical protein